jgi:hypothetical protein
MAVIVLPMVANWLRLDLGLSREIRRFGPEEVGRPVPLHFVLVANDQGNGLRTLCPATARIACRW